MDQTTAASETHDSRPPVVVAAPPSGVAAGLIRPTARQRAIITPLPWQPTDPAMITYPLNHPYERLPTCLDLSLIAAVMGLITPFDRHEEMLDGSDSSVSNS